MTKGARQKTKILYSLPDYYFVDKHFDLAGLDILVVFGLLKGLFIQIRRAPRRPGFFLLFISGAEFSDRDLEEGKILEDEVKDDEIEIKYNELHGKKRKVEISLPNFFD